MVYKGDAGTEAGMTFLFYPEFILFDRLVLMWS
jgi:hypothetical protein